MASAAAPRHGRAPDLHRVRPVIASPDPATGRPRLRRLPAPPGGPSRRARRGPAARPPRARPPRGGRPHLDPPGRGRGRCAARRHHGARQQRARRQRDHLGGRGGRRGGRRARRGPIAGRPPAPGRCRRAGEGSDGGAGVRRYPGARGPGRRAGRHRSLRERHGLRCRDRDGGAPRARGGGGHAVRIVVVERRRGRPGHRRPLDGEPVGRLAP